MQFSRPSLPGFFCPILLLLAAMSPSAFADAHLAAGDCERPAVQHDLRHCSLSGKRLAGVDVRGADLRWAKMIGARLGGADLSGADMFHVVANEADLTGASLFKTNLFGALLNEVIARDAEFTQA